MGLSLGPKAELLTAKQGENDKGFFERRQVVVQNDDLMQKQAVNWALGVFKFDHLAALVRIDKIYIERPLVLRHLMHLVSCGLFLPNV